MLKSKKADRPHENIKIDKLIKNLQNTKNAEHNLDAELRSSVKSSEINYINGEKFKFINKFLSAESKNPRSLTLISVTQYIAFALVMIIILVNVMISQQFHQQKQSLIEGIDIARDTAGPIGDLLLLIDLNLNLNQSLEVAQQTQDHVFQSSDVTQLSASLHSVVSLVFTQLKTSISDLYRIQALKTFFVDQRFQSQEYLFNKS